MTSSTKIPSSNHTLPLSKNLLVHLLNPKSKTQNLTFIVNFFLNLKALSYTSIFLCKLLIAFFQMHKVETIRRIKKMKSKSNIPTKIFTQNVQKTTLEVMKSLKHQHHTFTRNSNAYALNMRYVGLC